MDSLITSAALALARGDFFCALNRVALRDDAPALALRGIAMAQLGDLETAKILLRKAARAFGAKQPLSKARCILAEMEIAFAMRDLDGSASQLETAQKVLEQHSDSINAAYARHLRARLLLLFGHLDEAETLINTINQDLFSPAFKAAHELVVAGIAIRRIRTQDAKAALARAYEAACKANIPSLFSEIENALKILQTPAARVLSPTGDQLVVLEDVEKILASSALVVDACRYLVRYKTQVVSLASRPIFFKLAVALAEAWPQDISRDQLVRIAFRHKQIDKTLRARLRVEIGRLRAEIATLADIKATPDGFILVPSYASELILLGQPIRENHGEILAMLADGEAWASSALAMALGISQRTAQRALESLASAGKVQSIGRGQARRWIAYPPPGVTTILLLPGPLPVN